MDWAQILVIILSIFLAAFLLMGIVLISMLIKLTRQIKDVTQSAQRTAEHIEHNVARFSSATSYAYIVRKALSIIKKVRRR